MIKEKSCGAVIYIKKESTFLFLLIQMNQGHWSIPKGHVEKGETEIETALREIKEETNLDCEILEGFRKVVKYSPYPNVIKDVVFYLAKANSDKISIQTEEVTSAAFFSESEASALITFETDKGVFRSACEYIQTLDLGYEDENTG